MKKILSLIGAVSLTAAGASSVIACEPNKNVEYTDKELLKLKKINKIDTANQEIKDNLEWIAPQEEPFNIIDNLNHYFYVVWRGDEENIWRIIKFKYNSSSKFLDSDDFGNSILLLATKKETYLVIKEKDVVNYYYYWSRLRTACYRKYFKSVYRWNLDTKNPIWLLIVMAM
ncbi:lipoprotein [Spiroplasma citri]|uniref:lipoprotein n=1 Tax=Spiroplasma citri TaxID=2133 RepID=UPI0013A09B59|nr:lipoprotein [Spiroplasma citri]QIA75824.1 lipoprotein [Spiroplasma citri]